MEGHIGTVVAVLTIVLSTIVMIITGTWKLSGVKEGLLTRINMTAKEMDEDLQVIRHEVGETIGALREKITIVELYVRDNYVRRDSFDQSIDALRDHIGTIASRLETQMARLELKLDKVVNSR